MTHIIKATAPQKVLRPISSTHSRTISLKWSLLNAYNSLLDSFDDLKVIQKDKNYRFTHEDIKEIKNKLAQIQLLLPELKEKYGRQINKSMYDSIEITFKTGDQMKARVEIERRENFDTTFEYVAKEVERIHRVLMNQKAAEPTDEDD